MRTVVLGPRPPELEALVARRRALGLDGYDEVWEGEYHMAPAAHPQHGVVQAKLLALLVGAAEARGLEVAGPVNIGDPEDYRVPDGVVVYSTVLDAPATTAFLPSAAVVVEVASPDDESYAKLDFYFRRGVDEVLIVDLECRAIAWHARSADGLTPVARSALLDLDGQAVRARLGWS